jgi:protein O-GlcNAc transferase
MQSHSALKMTKQVQTIEPVRPDTFESAMTSFRHGNRPQAAAQCEDILKSSPRHAGANHLLGVLHFLNGDAATAEALIRTSLATTTSAEGEADLALALKAQKRYEEAEHAVRRALSMSPRFAIAHHTLGRNFDEQGALHEAEAAYRRAIELDPNAAEFRFNLGKLLSRTQRLADAPEQLRHAAALRPNWAEAHNSLGIVLAQLGLYAEAETALRRALELNPRLVEAWCNLGVVLMETQRPADAEHVLRTALSVDSKFAGASEALAKVLATLGRIEEAVEAFRQNPAISEADAGALNALGAALAQEKRFAEAEPALRRAVELNPNFASALSNLGSVLLDTGRHAGAETLFRRALECDPTHWGASYNLSVLLKNIRKLDEGEMFARRTLEVKPRFAPAYVSLGNLLLAKGCGDITEALDCFRRAIELDPDCLIGHSNLSYALTFISEKGDEVLEESRRFATHFEAPLMTQPVRYRNELTAKRRLRIGYVSPDFRNHCQSLFMLPLLRNHDHEQVEVHCYSSVETPDNVTHDIMRCADVWRAVHGQSDEQLAAQIMEDRIDILVDLTMHMANARPLLFARRPAPVQVAWLAYPGTTGSSAIGYRFTDPRLDPPGFPAADARYSEKSIRLPDTFWCYDPLLEGVDVSSAPAVDAGHITFGCLNNPCKLTDRTFALWAEILRQVENSRMILLLAQGRTREQAGAKFAKLGIDPARFTFVDYQVRDAYMRTYRSIDIVLDTYPYNGHTTSLDALWMGVPVVSRTGDTPAARAGLSLLSNLGLEKLTSSTDEDFVTTAVKLAKDQPTLSTLRSSLRERVQRSPLMDGARFARGMEAAYRSIWDEHLASHVQA